MLRSKKNAIFRFNHELPEFLPLAVRSTGSYSLALGILPEPPMKKWFTEIFWSEEGCGEFEVDKQWVRVQGCDIFFLLPGELHHIRPVSERWTYHWFTLDHPQSALWVKAFGVNKRPLPTERCPVELFRKLAKVLVKGSPESDRTAARYAHDLLIAATERLRPALSSARSSWVEKCRELIDAGYQNPQLNVDEIARKMKVHRVTLFRAFRQAYQITPSHYLQSRRLHHAIELLKNTDIPIKEVAQKVGLADANYLSRLIREVSHITPRAFRSGYRQQRMETS